MDLLLKRYIHIKVNGRFEAMFCVTLYLHLFFRNRVLDRMVFGSELNNFNNGRYIGGGNTEGGGNGNQGCQMAIAGFLESYVLGPSGLKDCGSATLRDKI